MDIAHHGYYKTYVLAYAEELCVGIPLLLQGSMKSRYQHNPGAAARVSQRHIRSIFRIWQAERRHSLRQMVGREKLPQMLISKSQLHIHRTKIVLAWMSLKRIYHRCKQLYHVLLSLFAIFLDDALPNVFTLLLKADCVGDCNRRQCDKIILSIIKGPSISKFFQPLLKCPIH